MKQNCRLQTICTISYWVENVSVVQIEERLGVEKLAVVIMNFDNDGIEEFDYLVAALERNEYRSKPMKLVIDMNHRESPPAKPSFEDAQKLNIKALPPPLSFVFLGRDDTLLVIIIVDLNGKQVECLVAVLKKLKRAIG